MNNLLSLAKNIYRKIVYSIAFYPVLISVAFFFLAWLSLTIEDFKWINSFKENVPHLIIQDRETARVILSTLVASILSLTVFSFTMVMVVLNQASSNFSPRLLPGLISNKGHQIILGVYIGTLTFCMIILISLGAYGVDSTSFGLSTMIAALSGVICVGLFVSFINSISKAIQIHNIIDRVSEYSVKMLNKTLKLKSHESADKIISEATFEKQFLIDSTGYYRGFDTTLLSESLKERDVVIEILDYEDEHLWKGAPMARISGMLDKNDLAELRSRFQISTNRDEGNSSIGGMIQLMEVAVKAMSPGINDPGTAINVIKRLGMLMEKALQIPDRVLLNGEEDNLKVVGRTVSCEILMQSIVQPIRFYSKKDYSVITELTKALKYLENNTTISKDKRTRITVEIQSLYDDVKRNMENENDKKRIINLINPE